tara:strand:- start:92 stop:835 length:744 start_codon:yes stop_codon:yes gene_type:complete
MATNKLKYVTEPPTRGDFYGKGRFKTTNPPIGETFDEVYSSIMLNELDQVMAEDIVVIYPGRFHPFHKGHAAVYNKLSEKFPNADIYITTSNKIDGDSSPFTFDEKKHMMVSAGVDPDKVVEVRNPYNPVELLQRYDSDSSKVIFAISAKDMEGPTARFKFGTKKDGSPSYFQPFISVREAEFMGKHGYIDTLPTINFKINGQPVKSASEVRKAYKNADIDGRKNIIQALYGSVDNNILQIFNSKFN